MEDRGLLTTKVPRALEIKSKLFGYELPDLLLIFFNLAITNLVFGGTNLRYPLVWGTTLGLALLLYFAKRGKPDSFIQHYGEFLIRPAYYAAGATDKIAKKFNRRRKNDSKKSQRN
jgi:hypothetical protein